MKRRNTKLWQGNIHKYIHTSVNQTYCSYIQTYIHTRIIKEKHNAKGRAKNLQNLQKCIVTVFPDKEQCFSNKTRLLWIIVSNGSRCSCISYSTDNQSNQIGANWRHRFLAQARIAEIGFNCRRFLCRRLKRAVDAEIELCYQASSMKSEARQLHGQTGKIGLSWTQVEYKSVSRPQVAFAVRFRWASR